MKHLKFLLVALIFATTSYGQGVTRGTYGTQSPYASTAMHIANGQGVLKVKDTLTGADTGYLYIFEGDGYNKAFDVVASKLTGTVSTYTVTLSGCNNNGKPLTAAQVPTANCKVLTGNTTYCASCLGTGSTTVPVTNSHYMWQFPDGSGPLFDNFIVQIMQTGTTTTIYSGGAVTEK